MNRETLNRLFAAARRDARPAPPGGFAEDVLRAVSAEPVRIVTPAPSVTDQLSALFPRLAVAAVAIIIVCAAADRGLTAAGWPDVDEGVASVSGQFTFDAEDL